MKLTTLILITAILQVSANTFAQKVTLSEKSSPLNKVFEKISDQTGYDFIVSTENLKQAKPVTINVQNEELKTALDKIFSAQPLNFVVQEKMVVVSKKPITSSATNRETTIIPVTVTGKVADTLGMGLPGATLKIKGNDKITLTDSDGSFTVNANDGDQIVISFIGYNSYTFTVTENMPYQKIVLRQASSTLEQISIVSTGYQTIPKERATGSFVLIDSSLVNRKVSTSILDRLDGVTSGLIFNRSLGTGNNAAISIRGRSTIFANPDPLIVLDNFPYDGDLNNINPNDIESISILKDAAAASIWGVKAGNGVIVITTKKGKSGITHVSFNASTTVSNRPNLHYQPQASSAEYINLEQYLFQKGYYDNTINDGYSTISPAIAIFLQKRNGQISAADSAQSINQLKKQDVGNDLEKYIYRPSVNQQYAISLDGGSDTHTYYVSAGYNKDLSNIAANSYDRLTLNASNSYYFLKNKLQVTAGLLLTTSNSKVNNSVYTTPAYPYEQLADANGNHLPVVQVGGLRKQYIDTAGAGKLLDWNYRPLDENSSNNITRLTDYKLNANIKYNISNGFNFLVNYQYEKGISDNTLLYSADSFYARNLINTFSQIDPTTFDVTRAVPLGAINNYNNSNHTSNYGRAQINYAKKFGDKHELNLLAGVEVKSYQSVSNGNILYGFNPSDDSSIPVDNITYFPEYYGYYNSATIPYGNQVNFSTDRTRSAFFNGSYNYDGKYTLSVSARRDESNIFGVKTNQKGVPLWSSGLMWNINKESFYHFEPLPVLKLRVTYGYNGNVDKTTSAYLTAQDGGRNVWNTEYTNIINSPNPALRWEKDRNINFGLDFITKGNLFSGNIDYYIKNGTDLIANSPIAPQTGVIQFKGNSADTKTTGVDFVLNKNSIGNSAFKWQSSLLFSYNKDIITNYKVKQGNNSQVIIGNYINPVQGYPYNAIFSYPFKGLDNQGKPQGLLNGVVSEDYTSIETSSNISNLAYSGSATPLIYGSFRNDFTYASFDLSFNITYKFDYYFRRQNVFSGSNNFGSYGYMTADFDKRWQAQGDELKTNIPALTYPQNDAQDSFYGGSSILVEKADNIKLQDIRLSYHFKSNTGTPLLKNLQVYAYVNNIAILWKATKQNIDPDYLYSAFANPKTFSIGLSTNF